MKRADSVLETLRRGAPEQNYSEAAARLFSAVRDGQGHIVVLGDSQHEAAVFVDSVLARASGHDIAQISIRRGANSIAPERLEGDAVLVVVHDADAASPAELEDLSLTLERSPDAVQRIRFILVGAARLERALVNPQTSALNSRVGARIRLVRKTAQRHAVPVVKRSNTKRWAVVTSGVTACAALVFTVVAIFSPGERTALIGLTNEQIAAVSDAINALVSSADASADTKASSSTPTEVPSASSSTGAPIEQAAAVHAAGGASFGEHFANFIQNAAYAAARAPQVWSQPASDVPSYVSKPVAAPVKAPSAPWTRTVSKPRATAGAPSTGLFAALAKLFVRDSHGQRTVETGGAVLETALMSAKLARGTRRAADGVLELGSFARAKSAYDLKSSLTEQFNRVAVARFDPPSGPVYSVRVFDLAGQEIEAPTPRP
jgi:hypothetical protein